MRYERKYRIEESGYQEVYQVIMSITGAFEIAYPDRWVNSIYLDDLNFKALNDNLSGISNRSKYRLRWYGNNIKKIKDPVLEKKIKENQLGYKKLFPLKSLDNVPIQLREVLNIPMLNDESVFPVVLVKYRRTYLQSFNKKVRITIDRNLQYFGMNDHRVDAFPILDPAIILEIKYDEDIEEEISEIFQAIPYRLTKNSKFCSGMLNYWE